MTTPENTETSSESADPRNESAETGDPSAETAALKAKVEEQWNQILRTTADFENFKKRAARERQEAVKHANEGLLERLIPVLDNFEMALVAGQQSATAPESIMAGVSMIQQQLKSALVDSGLVEISAQGQVFDPNIHEAVSQQETREVPEGHVLQQLRKGYRLRERLLRPATVIVAKAPQA
ncbi:MAG: nucleotide exchange factor GrpE [Verrucomicrobia bacterium]|nr:nucleotide exchange factor GrpE [Verrucomicrobiota bacterium]MBI3867747.1 nucleotide exchange factor GrpE [Verrucomicrobiota bacterium]